MDEKIIRSNRDYFKLNSQGNLPVVVILSSYGTFLPALLNTSPTQQHIEIQAVIDIRPEALATTSISPEAQATSHTEASAFPVWNHLHPETFLKSENFAHSLCQMILKYKPELIVLADTPNDPLVVTTLATHFQGRLIHLQPSRLPDYSVVNPLEKILQQRPSQHGMSLHFVTTAAFFGPILCQTSLLLQPEDNATSLHTRHASLAKHLLPETLSWFADQRIVLEEKVVYFDGKALPATGLEYRFF